MIRTKSLGKLYSKESGRWLIAFLMTAIVFLITGFLCDRVFFINDDENIMYTLAGYYTNGIPYDHSFVNYVLGGILRFFYTIVPSVPWYGVFHVTVLLGSVTAIISMILKEGYYKKISLMLTNLIALALFLSVFMFPTLLMQFTTTSAYAGVAAVVLILGINCEHDTGLQRFITGSLSTVFLLLCWMHRKNTGYVILCFYFGTVLYQLIKHGLFNKQISGRRKKIVGFSIQVGVSVLLLGLVIGISAYKRSTPWWDYFYEYDNARFKMTDYPHDSFSDNPQLYTEIGWNEELYELAGKSWWFFMDSNINAESFKRISETGYYEQEGKSIQTIIDCAESLFLNDRIAQIAVGSALVLCLVIIILCAVDKKRSLKIWEYLYILCITLGTVMLCIYLCYIQRFPLRAFHTIILPYLAIAVLVVIRVVNCGKDSVSRIYNGIFKSGVVISFFAALVLAAVTLIIARKESEQRIEKSERTLQIEQYAIENPDNFYVYDTSLTFRYLPFTVYDDVQPSNIMFWGGMGWNSPAFFAQLEQNGFSEAYSDMFFAENVYYISWDDYLAGKRTMRDRFMAYMESIYGEINIEKVDTLGNNINVYKLSR